MLLRIFILIALGFSEASCLKIPINVDAAPLPSENHDLSVLMQGCESKPTSGYLFCKLQQGADPTQIKIRIFSPGETCLRDSCFKFQFLRKDGSLGFAGAIKKEKSFADVLLSDIVSSPGSLSQIEAGEYQVMIRIWWIDATEKIEKTSRADGLVRVWLTDTAAQPFACNDPQLGWQDVLSKTCRADISSSFRVAMCGEGCER